MPKLAAASAALAGGGLLHALPALTGVGYALPPFASLSAKLRRRLAIEDSTSAARSCALTFDDGPHLKGTLEVLEQLASVQAPATFFLVGEQVRANPSLAREIVQAGHSIGLHCDRHRNLLRLSPMQVSTDFARAQDAIVAATGVTPTLYRPPYGILSSSALLLARQRQWRVVLWSGWGRDWEASATPESIAQLITDDLRAGAVLLLHDADDYGASDSWRRTAAALPYVFEAIAERDLQAVAL